jgi:DNA-binding Lrp family transcriptional regulator
VSEADVVRRLDRLIGVLELAHREDLQKARVGIRSDKTNAEILDRAAEETPAGALSKAVQKKTGQSPKTVQRRIADLVEIGALERIGAGNNVTYKATGLV